MPQTCPRTIHVLKQRLSFFWHSNDLYEAPKISFFLILSSVKCFDLTVGLNLSIFSKLEIFIKCCIKVIFRCLKFNVLLWLCISQTIPHPAAV